MPTLWFAKVRVVKQTRFSTRNAEICFTVYFHIGCPRGCKVTLFSQREEFLKSESARFSTLLVEPAGVDCWHWLVGSNCSLRAPFTDPQSRSRPATCVVTYFQQEVHSSFSKLNLQNILTSKEVYYAVFNTLLHEIHTFPSGTMPGSQSLVRRGAFFIQNPPKISRKSLKLS